MTDRSQFIAAAEAAAHTVDDPESSDHGRILIHCRGSFTGADWDLDAVIAEIEHADEVWWDTDSFSSLVFGHQLKCQTGEQVWSFAVKQPEVPA